MFSNNIHFTEKNRVEIDSSILSLTGTYQITIWVKGNETHNHVTFFMTKEQFEQTKQAFKEWTENVD